MAEPAFNGAGRRAGLELWRIEALKPVKQPQVEFLSILLIFRIFTPIVVVL